MQISREKGRMKSEAGEIRQALLETIDHRDDRITPADLEKRVARATGATRRIIRSAIRSLVAEGHLAYTQELGRTCIGRSFNTAVRISRRVVLKPPSVRFSPATGDVVIAILPGASFGSGQHPTTRLAVRGLEHILPEAGVPTGITCLDVGTGSGILAIAALGLGARRAIGLDIDPCARHEARTNARLNGIEDRFEVHRRPVEKIPGPIDLILANLRYPTLRQMADDFSGLLTANGSLVVSGLRVSEAPGLIRRYAEAGCQPVWRQDEKNWSGLVFNRAG